MITLVFGRRAGLYGAESAKDIDTVTIDESSVQNSVRRVTRICKYPDPSSHAVTKKRIQTTMKKYGWVIKDETGLKQGLRELSDIETAQSKSGTAESQPQTDELITAIEVPNLLLCSQLMLSGAIERRESRGAFFRDDYPDSNNKDWLKNIIYQQIDGELNLRTEPIDMRYISPQPESVDTSR